MVTGIFEDYPANTHFRPEYILSLKSLDVYNQTNNTNHFIATYVKLKPHASKIQVEKKLPDFMQNFYGKDYYDFAKSTYLLQAITSIHLDTTVYPQYYETNRGDSKTLIIFPILGLLILMIAIINYLNLTLAEGFKKGKSFGVNKIIGAGKFYFIRLYLQENLLLIGTSLIVAVLAGKLLLPYFNSVMSRELSLHLLKELKLLALFILVILLLISVNTLIPVLVFSRKKSIQFISENKGKLFGRNRFQQFSQTIQFSICIFLLIGALIIYRQLKYIEKTTNSSMNIDNVLVIKNARYLKNQREAFKQQLLTIAGVKSVSLCSDIPGNGDFSNWGQPVDKALENIHVSVFNCDRDYLKTLNIELIKGRFFSEEYGDDVNAIVLNEKAIKELGWKDDPIGKRYSLGKTYHVVGVTKNVHFESLQYEIFPQAYIPNYNETSSSKVIVKLSPQNIEESMKQIESHWNEFVPTRKMYFGFLDLEYEKWYASERKTSSLSIILSVIAIILSNLGLLAATLFTVQSRIKEIGIRKVNGAKVFDLLSLMNADFIKLMTIAFVVACPIAWLTMQRWLNNFAYKNDINWWIFAITGLLTVSTAILTVSWQSWSVARRNPVEALRSE